MGNILGWAELGACWRTGLQADFGRLNGFKGSMYSQSTLWGIKDSQGDLKVKPSLSQWLFSGS